MAPTQWERLAARLWPRERERPADPVDIEYAVMGALPVEIRRMDRPSIRDIEVWARRRGYPCDFGGGMRRPRGCLIAHRGAGVIIVDSSDAPDEVRFTVAHEAAHFLLDYEQPRARAVAALGASVLAALDGDRPATVAERMDAVLAGLTLGPHAHLMERGAGGEACAQVSEAEYAADALALELLAPAAAARKAIAACTAAAYAERRARAAAAIARRFGLPAGIADAYAARLLAARGGGLTFAEWLAGEART